MRVKFRVIPPLFTLFIGGLTGVLAISILCIPALHSEKSELLAIYGKTVATMASQQASELMPNQDRVSLRLIMSEVEQQPLVAVATVHDIENKLLAQAGKQPEGVDTKVFTSPIVIHDSIAGYLTLTLDPRLFFSAFTTSAIFVLSIVFSALAAWSLIKSNAIELDTSSSPKTTTSNETPTENNKLSNPEQIEEPAQESPKVYTVIQIKNLNVLKQQLNSETLSKTLKKVSKITSDVLALYNGSRQEINNDCYTLSFNASDDTHEALFRAVCSARLIVELASIINSIPLDLAALVSTNKDDLIPANIPVAGIQLEENAANDEIIIRRLQFMDVDESNEQKIISEFEQPFQNLLENQRKQLAKLV